MIFLKKDDKIKNKTPDNSGKNNSESSGDPCNSDFFTDLGFGDIFDFFGGEYKEINPERNPQTGADIHKQIEIQSKDAIRGVDYIIEVLHSEHCQLCHGSGIERRENNHFLLGKTTLKKTCTRCGGTGCCRETRKVSIPIPAGIENGKQFRVKGFGDAGNYGGPSGDLVIDVHIQ